MSASPSFGGPTPLWTGRQGCTNNLVVTRLCCDDLSQVMETTGPQLWLTWGALTTMGACALLPETGLVGSGVARVLVLYELPCDASVQKD